MSPTESSVREGLDSTTDARLGNSRIVGTGEMADLIRDFDWKSTSLGALETWSDTLVTTVNLLLASRHPMFFVVGTRPHPVL